MDTTTILALATAVVVGIAIVVLSIRQTNSRIRKQLREVPIEEAMKRFSDTLKKQLMLTSVGIEDLDEFVVSALPAKRGDVAFVLGVAGLIPDCLGLSGTWKILPTGDASVAFVTTHRELPLTDWVRARIGTRRAPSLPTLLSSLDEKTNA